MLDAIVYLLFSIFILHYIYYIYNSINNHPQDSKMQSEDAKFIKKRFRSTEIEPHPHECSIIVNYKLEAAVYGNKDMSDPMLAEKKDCQRIIRLKTLNAKTDVKALAREVVEKCDLVHQSQISDVEQIIYFLKNRKNVANIRPATVRSKSEARLSDKINPKDAVEEASIRNIDEYIDLLYEELPDRIRGSALILQLARNPDNLDELQKNEAVLSALSRVVREDHRKSIDLCINIVYTFFCFSTYTRFHSVIIQYKIGSLCIDIIESELKKYNMMKMEIERRKTIENSDMNSSKSRESLEAEIINVEKPKEMEPPRRRIPELKQRPKSGNWSNMSISSPSLAKTFSLNNSYHEGLSRELQIVDNNHQKDEEDEKINKQFKTFVKKQEQLLRVAFYLLLNIAENTKLEEKMRRKNIIKYLVETLDRQNTDLLILVVTFLKKLSIIKENKEEMKELNVVEKLSRVLQSPNEDLLQATLKLVFNLSFDAQLRAKMIRHQFIPKLVHFMSDEKYSVLIKILYHFSMDDKIKSLFALTDCIPLLMDMLVLNLNKKSDVDLVALGINLALNKKCAQRMCEQKRLKSVIERSFKYHDDLLMKLVRNLSMHDEFKSDILEFVDEFIKAVVNHEYNDSFIIDCIAILGNMNTTEIDYSQVLQTQNLLSTMKNTFTLEKTNDDLVLQEIMFLCTCIANDELSTMLICKTGVVLALIDLLRAKQEDDEIVLQIIFMFQLVLRNESTRNYIISETETPAYLIDLMHDKNIEIRKVCDICLDIIAMFDKNWATRIKLEKFRNHNSQWISMVESQEVNNSHNDENYDADDNDLPIYLTSDYLTQIYESGGDSGSSLSNNSHIDNSRPVSKSERELDLREPKEF